MINNKNINEWMTRFFNGETTCDEEKALLAYFRQTNISSSVEQYREMMEWYDAGMQTPNQNDVSKNRKVLFAPIFRYISIAASMLIVITVGFNMYKIGLRNSELNELYKIYKGSYIIENGVKNANLGEILPEVQLSEQYAENCKALILEQALDGVDDVTEREYIIEILSTD